jgi:hypothetical protein
MKAIAVVFLSLLAVGAADPNGPGQRTRTWSPSTDFGPSDNQISFHQGMGGVWYFMKGHSAATASPGSSTRTPCR